MHNHFSLLRCKTLLAIEWQTNHKRYLFIMLAMISYWALYGLGALWFLVSGIRSDVLTNSAAIRLAFGGQVFGFIGFVASGMFTDLGRDVNKSSYYLMLPGTTLEKFTIKLLISGFLFWVVFFTSTLIGLTMLWNIFYPIALTNDPANVLIRKQFDIGLNIQVFSTVSLFMNAFLVHSFFMTGSIVLTRFRFIKTLFIVVVFYLPIILFRFSIRQPSVYYLSIIMLTAILWFTVFQRLKKYTL